MPIFQSLNVLNIPKLYIYSVLIFLYKYHHQDLPNVFADFFMTNDTFHEHDARQGKQFRHPLARSNQRSRTMRSTGVKINNYFTNHMGYNGSFVMFKKEVKKFILENDVSLSCLWFVINIIHWICYYAWPAPSQCMGQRLLINKRRRKEELRYILNIRNCIVYVVCICAQLSICSPVVTFTGLSITASRLVNCESFAQLHVWRVLFEFGFEFEFGFRFKYDTIGFHRYMIHAF